MGSFRDYFQKIKEAQELNKKVCGNCYDYEYDGYVFVNEPGERMRAAFEEGKLDYDTVTEIMAEVKPNQVEKLKKNGVRVISAKENIADDPSGILVEGVLESMAEYYSAELSQKIRRGMDINAEKEKLLIELAKEENKRTVLSEAQIAAFLDYVLKLPADDINKKWAIINIFVNAIYLYDDHLDIVFNASNQMMEAKNIPIDDIEAAFNGCSDTLHKCSSINNAAPP